MQIFAFLLWIMLGSCLFRMPAVLAWGGEEDPLATEGMVSLSPAGTLLPATGTPCATQNDLQPLRSLVFSAVMEHALCRHPQTRQAWVNARVQAAQVGVSQGALLPTLTGTPALTHRQTATSSDSLTRNQQNTTADASLTLSWLLYDFGAREANLASARALLTALNADHATAVWRVYLAAARAYFQYFIAEATVTATREAEAAAATSLDAAGTRRSAGVGTPADEWQARTAHSQATLNRIRAEGDLRVARGVLAESLGENVDADVTLAPYPVGELDPLLHHVAELSDLLTEAQKQRPELKAAAAQVAAARAEVKAAEVAGLPTITLTTTLDGSRDTKNNAAQEGVVGVKLSYPLFDGYKTTYRLRAAREQETARRIQEEQTRHQVGLDVWKGYQQLLTETQALRTSVDLAASARQSERVARGRYEAGVGTILDLLTAQSTLADARRQHIQAFYNWHLARITLAQAVGRLDGN
ncbi:MAG: TolC family protein [Magnetococcus sp. DMHC-1]